MVSLHQLEARVCGHAGRVLICVGNGHLLDPYTVLELLRVDASCFRKILVIEVQSRYIDSQIVNTYNWHYWHS